MKKFKLYLDTIFFIFFIFVALYNMWTGVNNHDSYYLILALFNFIVIYYFGKDIEKDIDNM